MKDFAKSIRTGNAFDFDKRIISEREDSLRQAEESLKKAERDRNSHKGDGFFEEAYISAKNGVERARKNLDNARKAYIQTLERSKTGNSVPGSWRRIMLDGPAQQKDYKNYSIYVQEDKDEERGKTWWSWYVYKGDYEVAGGETNSEGSAKAAAESRLEGFLSRTGNSKVGNMRTDVVFRGHALTDDALRKLTPAEISELKREYESMLRDGAIDRSEYNETMDEIRRVRAGNSKTGNAKVDKEYSNGIKLVVDAHGSEYFWSIINRAGERVAFGMSKTYEKALSEGDAAAKRQEKRYTGNSKVGNAKFKIMQDLGIMGVFKIYDGWEADSEEEAVKEFIKLNPAYANGKKGYIKAEKTGNSMVGNSWDSVYKTIYTVKSYAVAAEDIFNGGNPNLDAVKRSLQQAISYAQKAISEVDAYKKESK